MNAYKNPNTKEDIAERRVNRILEELEKEEIIESFGWTHSFSSDDLRGIDFLIYPKKGKKIPLQVKSSHQKEHKAKYQKKGIYCIIIKPNYDDKLIKNNIVNILRSAEMKRTRQ